MCQACPLSVWRKGHQCHLTQHSIMHSSKADIFRSPCSRRFHSRYCVCAIEHAPLGSLQAVAGRVGRSCCKAPAICSMIRQTKRLLQHKTCLERIIFIIGPRGPCRWLKITNTIHVCAIGSCIGNARKQSMPHKLLSIWLIWCSCLLSSTTHAWGNKIMVIV